MKKWEVLNKELGLKNHKLSEQIICILLENRGIKTKQQREEYLNPTLDNFTAEYLGINKKDLKKAIARIKTAIEKKEQIIVFGDYDVDGVTGAAILWETLNALGAVVMPYIPHRIEEGYGLSKKGIDKVLEEFPKTKLIVTVDNGIVANEQVDYANGKNIEVIITDHHVPGEILPEAFAIIHSVLVCGAAVGYFLAKEISQTPLISSDKAKIDKLIIKFDHGEFLDLVALATVADVMQLKDLNRALLIAGLPHLRKTERLGLQSLISIAKIKAEEIGVYEIGHVIAPRINASGRLEHALESLRLICTNNQIRAAKLANTLDAINRERQNITFDSIKHAKENLDTSKKVFFVYSDQYEAGVIGLIAGKLTEEFYKPSIVLSVGEAYSKASARSVSGFNIIEFIRSHAKFLVDAGGHPMAAGFTIETKNLPDLEIAISESAKSVDENLLVRKIKIDCELDLRKINPELFFAINKLSPFGYGNSEPIFLAKNVVIDSIRKVGKDGKHLKLELKVQNSKLKMGAILFGYDESLNLKVDSRVDIVYSITENNWNGNKKLELKIKDIRKN